MKIKHPAVIKYKIQNVVTFHFFNCLSKIMPMNNPPKNEKNS